MSKKAGGRVVVIYGPPASGKSTITNRLRQIDDRYRLFPRLKAGRGRTSEYRITSLDQIEDLRVAGEIIWLNERYGAVYATDRPHLRLMMESGDVPVLHVGQRAAVGAIVEAVPDAKITTVSLTCPREIAVARIADRETGDTSDRIKAFDDTEKLPEADLVIDTSTVGPEEAASLIAGKVTE